MNDANRELLLKVRKGSDAGFSLNNWTDALTAMGFVVKVTERIRNSVMALTVDAPNGQCLIITKRPGYKRIVFYDLRPWAKKIGLELGQRASETLGMPTLDEERKLKELYVRDLTNTGTCPVCEGNFKRDGSGNMVHHGYQRPGDGFIHGDCFAVGYQAWEVSPAGAIAYVQEALRPHLASAEKHLERLEAGEVTKFFHQDHKWEGHRQVKVTIEVTRESDEYRFEQLLKSAIHTAKRDVEWTKAEISRFAARIDSWKPDVLPEVKHAGKFKAA